MKSYLVLFREPDGRMEPHSAEDIARHQANWAVWMGKWKEVIVSGGGLTLEGWMIQGGKGMPGIHQVGTEIVGGFLLVRAESLEGAVAMAGTCPIYEFDGYAEVREVNG